MPGFSRTGKRFLLHLAALILGAFLFAASFPNPVFINGLPFLAWIAYVPIFWLVNDTGLKASFFWGALYGYGAYGLFHYWMTAFHPVAGLVTGVLNLLYFTLLFPLLKLARLVFPKRGYILQWGLWLSYEYLRTLGFVGYSYGILGYSQWALLPVIQIAGLFGVWGVSALVVFPSAFIAWIPRGGGFVLREKIFAALWGLALATSLAYGCVSLKDSDYSGLPEARFALIQHNTDPWRGGIAEYRRNLATLKRLSEEALAQDPKPDIVVWSETAFVPRIYWHLTYRDDQASYVLVRELLDYLAQKDRPFVIGNDDARREADENGIPQRVDYNGVLLFEKGKLVNQYRKLHLVPFTEHFPYKKQLPAVYEALLKMDTHLWKAGNEATVFETGNIRFSTPICFEDTFGYLSREFTLRGAELIVNLSNDAWSQSLTAQMQHLGMAVFRAVENRRSVVRSTASGQTAAISPRGKITAMAPAFTEAYLNVEVPLMRERTLYTAAGDFFPRIILAFSLLALFAGILLGFIKKRREILTDESKPRKGRKI